MSAQAVLTMYRCSLRRYSTRRQWQTAEKKQSKPGFEIT